MPNRELTTRITEPLRVLASVQCAMRLRQFWRRSIPRRRSEAAAFVELACANAPDPAMLPTSARQSRGAGEGPRIRLRIWRRTEMELSRRNLAVAGALAF